MSGLGSKDVEPPEDREIPTPDFEVTDTGDPNPPDGNVNDTPPAGLDAHADGAVDAEGRMLDADGNPIPPRHAVDS